MKVKNRLLFKPQFDDYVTVGVFDGAQFNGVEGVDIFLKVKKDLGFILKWVLGMVVTPKKNFLLYGASCALLIRRGYR